MKKNKVIQDGIKECGAACLASIIKYYGGNVAGICSIFATVDDYMGYKVSSVFDPKDLEGYASHPSHDCPLCKAGQKIDGLVNSHGYSKL
jgi:orotate phosphoribosyltransferase